MAERKPAITNADAAEVKKFDALASRWWDPAGEMKPLHQINPLRLDYLEREVGLTDKQILDCGCGGGLLSEGMAQRGARHVLGIDLAESSLEVARLHAAGAEVGNVEYREVAVADIATERPAEFDLVTCLEVLEHVPDPANMVADLARLVRPGGHLVLSTLNRNAKAFALAIVGAEYLLHMVPAGTHEYERFIKPSELDTWARAAGCELVDLTGIVFNPLSGGFRLSDTDIDVNYLAHFRAVDADR